MLYNPEWETKPETKPSFVRWLEQQPADKTYNYGNMINCGYAQYLRSRSVFALVTPGPWIGLWLGVIPVVGYVRPRFDDALRCSRTFGEVLNRTTV